MRRCSSAIRVIALLMAGAATLPVAAHAQDAVSPEAVEADGGVEAVKQDDGAIIVTARRFVPSGAITASKTTAPLIETPQSVSVISRDQIDLLNFVDVQQAVRYTAGVAGENYGPDLRFDFLRVRGFVPVQYIDGMQAPVSDTIDNVGIDLYGFDAIDILKGSASTLYGSTPPGGIYNLTSRRPSTRTGGEIQVKYGTDDFKQVAGTVTGELTNGISARLTGLYRDRDGQTDFVTARRAYVAPAVTFEIGPDTKLTALGYYQWDRVEGDTNGFLPANGVLFDNPVGKVRRGINLGEPDYNFYRREQWGAGYELTHRFSSALSFTQNLRWTDYSEYQQIIYASGLAADNRTVSRSNFPFADDTQQFAVDNRFDANFATGAIEHRVLVGFDYRNYREQSAFAFAGATDIDLFDPVYSTAPITAPALGAFTDVRLKQYGLYAQDQMKIDNFILTLSGRQDWSRVTRYLTTPVTQTNQDKFTWRVGATYVTEAGVAPYVSYSTSFLTNVGSTIGGTPFVPSTGKQWEAGVKYDARNLGDDVKLFATAALFRIVQDNPLLTDPNAVFFDIQTGRIVSKGFEAEFVGRFYQKLSVNASYSFTDAKITRSDFPPEVGARLEATPRHKASLFVDYTQDTGALAGFGGGAGVRYLSSSPGVTPSTIPAILYTSPAVTLFDATLHYDIPGWRLAINGSNIFDKRYAGRCNGPVGCFFAQSRQIVATATKRF
ncbi:iron complex outermembrane receptor protein [Sphingopyxis panaciterrae]|uniref:TonB-dependent siderophore receptor n=1 Tax=Sphingopyxis panaciterrae TaxID=363841 RepID=UPI00141E93FC|nr:TonB-dependent siderophore receptor [Sphingopyxis panaciterrae]NIJ39166.1 iron complex outermembrane receptor protein [Sphingopyxis panaciterrae]